MQQFIKIATETAMLSDNDFMHGAILISGGKVLCTAYNMKDCIYHAEYLVLKGMCAQDLCT